MATPTPTVQDGEQLDLRCDETKFWHAQLAERDETIRQREELHHEDVARNVRLVANVLSLEDQLAALRAQVEAARVFLAKVRKVTESDEYLGMFTFCMVHGVLYRGDNFKAEADALSDALATPQPVVKEK